MFKIALATISLMTLGYSLISPAMAEVTYHGPVSIYPYPGKLPLPSGPLPVDTCNGRAASSCRLPVHIDPPISLPGFPSGDPCKGVLQCASSPIKLD